MTQVYYVRRESVLGRKVDEQPEALAGMGFQHGCRGAARTDVDGSPGTNLRFVGCPQQLRIGHKILIADHGQQQSKRRHGKRRAEPGEPSRSCSANRLIDLSLDRWFGKDYLALFHEHGRCAQIERAILTVKEVLLELIPEFRVEFIQQISLRGFLPDRLVMVHDSIPS